MAAKKRAQKDNDAQAQAADDEEEELVLKKPEEMVKHLFLQSLMSRKIVSLTVARALYAKAVELCKVKNAERWNEFRDGLEPELNFFGLEIKQSNDPVTGDINVVLVNSNNNDTAKLATEYLPQELAFYRVVIAKIMNAKDLAYAIPFNDALRATSDPSVTPQITKQAAQGLIKSLIARGWLNIYPSKQLTLSARALTELSSYLRDNFHDDDEDPDEKVWGDCLQCHELVTIGQACPKEGCGVRVHNHCSRMIRNGVCPGEPGVPKCGEQWEIKSATLNHGNPIGIKHLNVGDGDAPSDDDTQTQQTQKKGAAKKSKPAAKGRTSGAAASKKKSRADDDDEEEEEEQDELEPTQQEDDSDDDIAKMAAAMTQAGVDAPAIRRSSRGGQAQQYAAQEEDDEMSE